MLDHSPFGRFPLPAERDRYDEVLQREPHPIVKTVFPSRRVERLTEWEILPPSSIVWHDSVFGRGKLQIHGEERYDFLGGNGSGSIAEITVLRRPVSISSRIGFASWPMAAARSRVKEEEVFKAIDEAFRRGGASR
jgi:hypothetical protein